MKKRMMMKIIEEEVVEVILGTLMMMKLKKLILWKQKWKIDTLHSMILVFNNFYLRMESSNTMKTLMMTITTLVHLLQVIVMTVLTMIAVTAVNPVKAVKVAILLLEERMEEKRFRGKNNKKGKKQEILGKSL